MHNKTANISNNRFHKTLTAIDLVFFGLGSIIGTGAFVLTGIIASKYSGPAIIISYLISGISCIFIALVYLELATMFSSSGGIYSYSYFAFGELIAWLVGSIVFIELCFTAATVASGLAAYLEKILALSHIFIPKIWTQVPENDGRINLLALVIVLLIGAIVYLGTVLSKKLNIIIVLLKLLTIIVFIIIAIPNVNIENWQNFMPFGWQGLLKGSSILLFAFTGFNILSSTVEECRNPKRDLTIGIVGSIILATLIYLMIGALITLISSYKLLNDPQAMILSLKGKTNLISIMFISIGAIVGMVSVIMMHIYAQSRILFVIARDGLLPKIFLNIHSKYNSPYVIIIVLTIIIAILSALFSCDFLMEWASIAILFDYLIAIIIVFKLRLFMPDMQRSFICPAFFIVAPIALFAVLYLLLQQLIDYNSSDDIIKFNKVLPILYWCIGSLFLYIVIKVTKIIKAKLSKIV